MRNTPSAGVAQAPDRARARHHHRLSNEASSRLPGGLANADQAYGEARDGIHLAGYSFERALERIEGLLAGDLWKECAPGFDDVNKFLASLRFDDFKPIAERRKKLALRIKELQPTASNRAIARALGVDHQTVNNGLGEDSPPRKKNINENNGAKNGGGENSPAALTSAAAAKLVQHRENRRARDAEAAARRQAVVPGEGSIECRHGDFRAVLADLHDVDAIITDPPYGREFLPLLRDLAEFADRILKPDGTLAVLYGQTHLLQAGAQMDGFRPYRWTACYLAEGKSYVSHQRGLISNWKPVLIYGGCEHRFKDVFRATGDDEAKQVHRWGQNLEAFREIIEALTDPGATIVDPFAGGGTTLIAAKTLGRHAIGAEIDSQAKCFALSDGLSIPPFLRRTAEAAS